MSKEREEALRQLKKSEEATSDTMMKTAKLVGHNYG